MPAFDTLTEEEVLALVEVIRAVVGLDELGTPVTGGNVSFYNQTAEVAILPTPVVGVLGVIGDGKPGLGPNRFDDPEGVAVHGTTYYFSDSDNNRVVRYVVVTH